jgi:hypothetical protein
MPIKIQVSRVVATEESTFEIPDQCPNPACGADFTGPGGITEHGYVWYVAPCHVDSELNNCNEAQGDDEYDAFFEDKKISHYLCFACGLDLTARHEEHPNKCHCLQGCPAFRTG